MPTTVLAHIASTITHKENVATDALAFIINSTPVARSALAQELDRLFGENVPVARVVTQPAGDESRPDLALLDGAGRLTAFIEAKFWAALTSAQPVEYLRRLADGGGGALLMLAPERRLQALRAEVIDRCREASVAVEPVGSWLLRGSGHSIGFLSWARLLATLTHATRENVAAASDVRQLVGLCERFETEEFIPLTRAELDDLNVPRRILALGHLVNEIVDRAAADGIVSTQNLRSTHSIGSTGRYVAFARAGCFLGLTHWQWSKHGRSPIWLRFDRSDWGRADVLRELLRPWADLEPPRAYVAEDDGAVRVPLTLCVAVEKDAVVAHAVAQLRELDDLLRAAGRYRRLGGDEAVTTSLSAAVTLFTRRRDRPDATGRPGVALDSSPMRLARRRRRTSENWPPPTKPRSG